MFTCTCFVVLHLRTSVQAGELTADALQQMHACDHTRMRCMPADPHAANTVIRQYPRRHTVRKLQKRITTPSLHLLFQIDVIPSQLRVKRLQTRTSVQVIRQ